MLRHYFFYCITQIVGILPVLICIFLQKPLPFFRHLLHWKQNPRSYVLYYFFHAEGMNSISIGYTSSRPKSIAKLRMIFPNQEKQL